jgi:hypothetical protein
MVYYEEDCKNIIIIGKAIAFQSDVRWRYERIKYPNN